MKKEEGRKWEEKGTECEGRKERKGKWAEEKEKRGEKGEEVEREMERSLGEMREMRERRVVSTSECSSISIYPEMREVKARSLLFNH